MQDDLNATLVLCEAADCPLFGSCHVECMPINTRPRHAQEKNEAGGGGDAGFGVVGGGQAGGDMNAPTPASGGAFADVTHGASIMESCESVPADEQDDDGKISQPRAANAKLGRSRLPAWRLGEPTRTWDLHDFSWYCHHCEGRRHGERSRAGDNENVAQGAETGKDNTVVSPAGGQPFAKPELAHSSRRLLKQYFELCTSPDTAQLSLLAAMTERGFVETQAWFHDKALQRQREERQKKLQQCAC